MQWCHILLGYSIWRLLQRFSNISIHNEKKPVWKPRKYIRNTKHRKLIVGVFTFLTHSLKRFTEQWQLALNLFLLQLLYQMQWLGVGGWGGGIGNRAMVLGIHWAFISKMGIQLKKYILKDNCRSWEYIHIKNLANHKTCSCHWLNVNR